jgi:SAM-dependent methyltransferase
MFTIDTLRPLAIDSNDYLMPFGARNDNSANPLFLKAVSQLLSSKSKPWYILDLGCAGGQQIADCLAEGWHAVGIDGVDFMRKSGLFNWPTLQNKNLFNCDITAPFQLSEDGIPIVFDIITGWEVLEHIRQYRMPAVMENIKRHLAPGGYFIGSISRIEDGLNFHVVFNDGPEPHNLSWWDKQFNTVGLADAPDIYVQFPLAARMGAIHNNDDGTPVSWFVIRVNSNDKAISF